jgi:hypothetical protein
MCKTCNAKIMKNKYSYIAILLVYAICFLSWVIENSIGIILYTSLYIVFPIIILGKTIWPKRKEAHIVFDFKLPFAATVVDSLMRSFIFIYFYFIKTPVKDVDDYWGIVEICTWAFMEIMILVAADFMLGKILKWYKAQTSREQ